MPNRTPSRFLVAALALCLAPVLSGAEVPAKAETQSPPLPPGAVAPVSTLHDGLEAARADRASSPEAIRAFQSLATRFKTPLYIYDKASIVSQARALKEAFSSRFSKLKIFYAIKANTNRTIISLLHSEGLGAEVVSGGELVAAQWAGVPGNEIMFTSSSKRFDEIEKAIQNGSVLNVDSRDELELVDTIAEDIEVPARISFRINPGVDPHTIHQINTGISDSKFGLHLEDGIALAAFARAKELKGVRIVGVHCHIGSQITETSGYKATAKKMLAFVRELKEKLGITLEFVDLGGGLGVPYRDGEKVMSPEDLAKALKPIWDDGVKALGYEPTLWLEPGRFFVAPSGFLLTRVNSVKTTPVKTFVNVDAGFETLMRPAMYQAYHRVRVIGPAGKVQKLDIAGDICETGDILAADRMLPRPKTGDLVVILDVGAYGFSMASQYNSRMLPAEVLVDGDDARPIRWRDTYDDLFRREVQPPVLKGQ